MQNNISNKTFSSFVLAGALLISGCGSQQTKESGDVANLKDLQIVDCLLPGQMRRLGGQSYLTQRRPAQVTAAECRIKGGEYVEYDRADYKTALKVWMPAAEAGDAEAQANVGQIFERGLGGEPNYEAAIIWYTKAAEKGNSRAQFNLGTLYEQGLGVEKNKLLALNWYRKAWGLPEDSVIYQSAASKEQEVLRAQLNKTLAEKNTQIQLLSRQISELEKTGVFQSSESDARAQELVQLKKWVEKLEGERKVTVAGIDKLPRYRQPEAPAVTKLKTASQKDAVSYKNIDFGKYYALVIGNQNYDTIDDLFTPHSDSIRTKELLENKYGFDVTVLLDADNANIMRAINDLNDKLKDNDNLLIFYAGHGERIKTGDYEAGYWLPVNASAPPDDTFWVSNEFVTRHLARIKAKRVMVVADSCYAGLLSDAPGYLFMGDDADYGLEYVKYKLPKKSRLLISSGGDAPVLDNFGKGHSVFARAFIDVLEQSEGVISGPELFLKVREMVTKRTKKSGLEQVPELKAIKGAGHEVGDFFFVKKS
ncbi:MAG: caspase family protein [Agarilytica sp.]